MNQADCSPGFGSSEVRRSLGLYDSDASATPNLSNNYCVSSGENLLSAEAKMSIPKLPPVYRSMNIVRPWDPTRFNTFLSGLNPRVQRMTDTTDEIYCPSTLKEVGVNQFSTNAPYLQSSYADPSNNTPMKPIIIASRDSQETNWVNPTPSASNADLVSNSSVINSDLIHQPCRPNDNRIGHPFSSFSVSEEYDSLVDINIRPIIRGDTQGNPPGGVFSDNSACHESSTMMFEDSRQKTPLCSSSARSRMLDSTCPVPSYANDFPIRVCFTDNPNDSNSYLANRYLLTRKICQTGGASVYEAMDCSTDSPETVCIKALKHEASALALFELRCLKMFQGVPNIIQLKDAFYNDAYLHLVFPLYDFSLLAFRMKYSDSCTDEFLCKVIHDVLVALENLHNSGVVHADIKPENILLNIGYQDVEVVLTDFGISLRDADLQAIERYSADDIATQKLFYVQSRTYRAPECILEIPFDEKIDIWALGCMVLELYCGFQAFNFENSHDHLSSIQSIGGYFPPRFHASQNLPRPLSNEDRLQLLLTLVSNGCMSESRATEICKFIQKMLAADPESRATATELLADPYFKTYIGKSEV